MPVFTILIHPPKPPASSFAVFQNFFLGKRPKIIQAEKKCVRKECSFSLIQFPTLNLSHLGASHHLQFAPQYLA